MSPLAIQAARLASRQALRAPVWQQAFRRSASSQLAKQYSMGTAPADWGRIIRTRTQALLLYFPGMAIALGWPYLAYVLVDGHVKM
ncbi:hypothetical protein EKO27_g8385 [Xylaria grammica]|uniref:Uncharacterized protein n=1 Tax=Xylaria grammica TaxID=363999 RepID=A0A439CX01_9PEZI|nr:hypothetical protein EKO27_g8385 [Xylaria grammica]